MSHRALAVALFSASLAASLAAAPALAAEGSGPAWTQVAYSCDSGQPLTVAYREGVSSVRVSVADGPVFKLNSRPSDAGFRYSDSRHELRGDGDEVQWKNGARAPVTCRSQDPAASSLALAAQR